MQTIHGKQSVCHVYRDTVHKIYHDPAALQLELQALGTLHKYVPRYWEHTTDTIVMTRAPGRILKFANKLPLSERILIICQLYKAFKYIWSKGIGHGDIHPENILWDGHQIIVIDWAMSRTVEEDKLPLMMLINYVLTGQFNDMCKGRFRNELETMFETGDIGGFVEMLTMHT